MHHLLSYCEKPWRAAPVVARGSIVFLLLFLASAAPAQTPPRRVLLLYAYNLALPATAMVGNGFRKRLVERSPQPVIVDGDFLDLVRISDPDYELRTAKFIHDKYAGTPPDIVVTVGGAAFPFALKFRNLIAPKAPIIFTNVSHATYKALRPPSDVTGLLLDLGPNLEKTLQLAERLQPDTRRLYLIAGDGAIDQRWQVIAREIIEKHKRKFETRYLFGMPYEQLVAEVSRIPRDSIVVNLTIFSAGTSKSLVPGEVVIAMADASPAPLYSPYNVGLGQGVLGGFSASFEEIGTAAADLALEILAGKNPADLPPRDSPGQAFRVDYNRLRQFNLSEQNLPEGTIVLFKEPGIWAQHRNFVLATTAIIAVLSGLVIALLIQRRRRRLAEAEAALQRQEVAHLMRVSVIGELSGAIAHEINQPLTAISTNAHAALDMVPVDSEQFSELRETIQDIIDEDKRASDVIERLRRLLKKDMSAIESIRINDLISSTIGLLNSELLNRKITVTTDLANGLPETSGDPIQIQQVLLNLLMNAMDAMGSTPAARKNIVVSTGYKPDRGIEIVVSDGGNGLDEIARTRAFEPFYTTKSHGLGLGLAICSTIVKAHGGTLSLNNADGGGATAVIRLPPRRTLATTA